MTAMQRLCKKVSRCGEAEAKIGNCCVKLCLPVDRRERSQRKSEKKLESLCAKKKNIWKIARSLQRVAGFAEHLPAHGTHSTHALLSGVAALALSNSIFRLRLGGVSVAAHTHSQRTITPQHLKASHLSFVRGFYFTFPTQCAASCVKKELTKVNFV